jgi:hypothetical protein
VVLIVFALIVIGGIRALIGRFSGGDEKAPAEPTTVATTPDQDSQSRTDSPTASGNSSGEDLVEFSLVTGKELGVKHVDKPAIETIKTSAGEWGVIPDVTSADVKLNLEKTWGLEWTGVQATAIEDWYRDEGSTVDPDTGATLTATISGHLPFKVCSAEFTVDATAVAGLVDQSFIDGVSEGFLGFAATIPVLADEANQREAKRWVEANVAKVEPGSPIETDIGPVHFVLMGSQWLRTLEVSVPAKVE